MVRSLALLLIISVLAVVDGVQRRNRMMDESAETAVGEVIEKRGGPGEAPARKLVLVLRLALPEDETVVLATEADADTWNALAPGDPVRVQYTPGAEVGTLAIRSIEPGPKRTPPAATSQDISAQ